MMDRGAALERLGAGETFDLLIIGGGAVGLGTAVEAAARGLRVALVERGDFAGGTSSRSTKLVHGGVRYLRQGNLSLVREGLRERARLLRNAPHLVTPLEFAVPCFGPIDTLFYGAGLKFYDALAAGHSLSPSRIVSAAALRREVAVKEDGLFAGVVYRDAQFDDARLAVALARTAGGLGAALANYCAATGLMRKGDRLSGAEARDEETGKSFAISARCVVNATGVFVDGLRRQDDAAVAPLVTVSQGIHLVLPRRFLPGAAALMVPKTSDGRVLFAIP
ncbi:MAG TPA: glycerol-3-phosphate dehydrogenase/oxidase, partial [Opitutaceae bacterium]|nr:glycerol-3-phosphate dehydrogenase/oxidase [Opitutaceae bacterium]